MDADVDRIRSHSNHLIVVVQHHASSSSSFPFLFLFYILLFFSILGLLVVAILVCHKLLLHHVSSQNNKEMEWTINILLFFRKKKTAAIALIKCVLLFCKHFLVLELQTQYKSPFVFKYNILFALIATVKITCVHQVFSALIWIYRWTETGVRVFGFYIIDIYRSLFHSQQQQQQQRKLKMKRDRNHLWRINIQSTSIHLFIIYINKIYMYMKLNHWCPNMGFNKRFQFMKWKNPVLSITISNHLCHVALEH